MKSYNGLLLNFRNKMSTKFKCTFSNSVSYHTFLSLGEGVRVFHWTDNKHLAAFFFSVKLRKGFQSAREYCAMNFDGSDLAVGFSDKELKFLAMTSFEEPAFGKRIHLGFRRKGKDQIFWSVTRGVPFGWSWAEKTPVLAEEQRYVCVQPGNVTRTTCNNDERPFICAVYYTKPETIHGKINNLQIKIIGASSFARCPMVKFVFFSQIS